MKRRAGMKPTSYDAAQFKTLYLSHFKDKQATAPVLVTPATPTELTATALSSASIGLMWSSTGEKTTNYLIESSVDDVTFTQIATVSVGVTIFTDTGLTASTLYYYRVRAASASTYSPYSNVASATTLAVAVVLDDFNRADEGPPPSASWVTPAGCDGLKVVGDECVPDGVIFDVYFGYGTWDAFFLADQVVYATIAAMPSTWRIELCARVPNPADSFRKGSYCVEAFPGWIEIWSYHADLSQHLLGATAITWAAGNRVKLSCNGTTIKAYADVGAGWVEKLNVTDASWPGAGYIGAYVDGVAAVRIDDFGGGEI